MLTRKSWIRRAAVCVIWASLSSLAWSALPWPGVGYPSTHFWKEEGVAGNTHMNVMIDQNGSVYDIYYPSPGAHQGVAAENEGYAAPQAHPPGTTGRGQMNVELLTPGLGSGGSVWWFTNQNGGDYTGHQQRYVEDTNVLRTSFTFVGAGYPLEVVQYDFCPAGINFPTNAGGDPLRGIYIKRVLITNNTAQARSLNLYFNTNFDINGGNSFDGMYYHAATNALVAYDNTFRNTNNSGEWNPLSFGGGYVKDVSLYFGVVGKVLSSVGGAAGTPADGNWREAGSGDNHNGWIGWAFTVNAGETKEIDIAVIGAFETGAGKTGTWEYWGAPAAQWFYANSMSAAQAATETYWRDWLASGTTMDSPNDTYDAYFKRGLLASMLHVDGFRGGIIAGMHNGAYPYVWPRDCVYAAVSLARVGHWDVSENVYTWLREIAYRANETVGRGFFYQKYTVDGHVIWNSPQVDETAVVPWGAYYHYLCTGDQSFLSTNWPLIWESAVYSSQDSSIDNRLRFEEQYNLMYSNNVWEDQWDTFLYSNASVERGLRDAAAIATVLGHGGAATTFTQRAATIHSGVDARLAWGGENVDVSQLGLVVPFDVYDANDGRMTGLYTNILNQLTEPGDKTIWRYVGDTYWGGGPWWLSTYWMGMYEARVQDHHAGKAWIDKHLERLDAVHAKQGPLGLGAEQIAPDFALVYPNFYLQTAYPNVWESMSTMVDAFMAFLDFTPNAPAGKFRLEPVLPSAWNTLTYRNLRVGASSVDATISESAGMTQAVLIHRSGGALNFEVVLRIPAGETLQAVTINGNPVGYNHHAGTGRVSVAGALSTTPNGITQINAIYGATGATIWGLY